jgi:hypothetical protein
MSALLPYAKAVVAVLMLVVVGVANALGVETGIDPTEWWHVLGVALLTGAGVYAVPNAPKDPDV